MSTAARLRIAAVAIADKIRAGETANIPEAILTDLEHYVLRAAEDRLRGDVEAFKKSSRAAGRSGAEVQIALPGMDYASLPFIVFVKDPDTGDDQGIPASKATKAQLRAEVKVQRRTVNVQDRIVSGWEATLDRLDDLDVPDEWTGAEIAAAFPREVER